MFDYSTRQIQKFLVMDRALTKYINKIDFRASGTIELTFSDGSVCEYEDLFTAALAIKVWITAKESANEPA